MGDLSLETLTLIINKDPRVLYLATLNNGKYCLAIFEKIQTVIQVNPSRLNIIMNNIKKPLMAFAECKERGVAELSMELIGELIKKIFSSKSESCENIGRDLKKIFVIFYNCILVCRYFNVDCAVTFRLCLNLRLFF